MEKCFSAMMRGIEVIGGVLCFGIRFMLLDMI